MIIKEGHESVKLECIKSMIEIFEKEPFLVLRSYENGMDFSEITGAVRNSSTEMALAAIEFWQRFIMIETISMRPELKFKLFDQ